MGKWIVLKVFSSSENQSMKTGCICVRSFRRTPAGYSMLCSLVWPWLPTSVFMSHMQQSSLADTAKTLLWGCYGFLCTRFLLQPSVRKCPIKLRVFFFRNLQISHLTHWVRIANVFTWLEILSSMWGLRIPQRQDLHAFTSTTVLKLSSVTWAVTKPWGLCVCGSQCPSPAHAFARTLTKQVFLPGWEVAPPLGRAAPVQTLLGSYTFAQLNACWKVLHWYKKFELFQVVG